MSGLELLAFNTVGFAVGPGFALSPILVQAFHGPDSEAIMEYAVNQGHLTLEYLEDVLHAYATNPIETMYEWITRPTDVMQRAISKLPEDQRETWFVKMAAVLCTRDLEETTQDLMIQAAAWTPSLSVSTIAGFVFYRLEELWNRGTLSVNPEVQALSKVMRTSIMTTVGGAVVPTFQALAPVFLPKWAHNLQSAMQVVSDKYRNGMNYRTLDFDDLSPRQRAVLVGGSTFAVALKFLNSTLVFSEVAQALKNSTQEAKREIHEQRQAWLNATRQIRRERQAIHHEASLRQFVAVQELVCARDEDERIRAVVSLVNATLDGANQSDYVVSALGVSDAVVRSESWFAPAVRTVHAGMTGLNQAARPVVDALAAQPEKVFEQATIANKVVNAATCSGTMEDCIGELWDVVHTYGLRLMWLDLDTAAWVAEWTGATATFFTTLAYVWKVARRCWTRHIRMSEDDVRRIARTPPPQLPPNPTDEDILRAVFGIAPDTIKQVGGPKPYYSPAFRRTCNQMYNMRTTCIPLLLSMTL